jgi:hypothetical protein
MDENRERALSLAQEAEMKTGGSDPQAVISRARVYRKRPVIPALL